MSSVSQVVAIRQWNFRPALDSRIALANSREIIVNHAKSFQPQENAKNSARHSRNRIVLLVVLVIEPRHSIEDEDEDENEDEKFARRANILRDSSTKVAKE